MKATTTRPKIIVTADGAGVVSHAGSRLLADIADHTTLTGELAQALDPGFHRWPGSEVRPRCCVAGQAAATWRKR